LSFFLFRAQHTTHLSNGRGASAAAPENQPPSNLPGDKAPRPTRGTAPQGPHNRVFHFRGPSLVFCVNKTPVARFPAKTGALFGKNPRACRPVAIFLGTRKHQTRTAEQSALLEKPAGAGRLRANRGRAQQTPRTPLSPKRPLDLSPKTPGARPARPKPAGGVARGAGGRGPCLFRHGATSFQHRSDRHDCPASRPTAGGDRAALRLHGDGTLQNPSPCLDPSAQIGVSPDLMDNNRPLAYREPEPSEDGPLELVPADGLFNRRCSLPHFLVTYSFPPKRVSSVKGPSFLSEALFRPDSGSGTVVGTGGCRVPAVFSELVGRDPFFWVLRPKA